MSQFILRDEVFYHDYRDQPLPDLLVKQNSDCDFTHCEPLIRLDGLSQVIDKVKRARQTLLLSADKLTSEALVRALQDCADNGVRIYVLLSGHSDNQPTISSLAGRCLVRSGVPQAGALLLCDHMTTHANGLILLDEAILCLDDSIDKSWGIELAEQQINDCYRSFCQLFWQEANCEDVQQHRQKSTNPKSAPHPDGTITTNHVYQLINKLGSNLANIENDIVGLATNVSHRLVSATNKEKTRLICEQEITEGAKIPHGAVITEKAVPAMLIAVEQSWLLPDASDKDRANWCVMLSGLQHQQIEAAFGDEIKRAKWQFKKQSTIGDLQEDTFLRFADKPKEIVKVAANHKNKIPDIYTDTLDEFLNTEAKELARDKIEWQRDTLAHEIDFEVTIHPPYCPPEAREDGLYNEWRKCAQNWQHQLAHLSAEVEALKAEKQSLSERIRQFLVFPTSDITPLDFTKEITQLKVCSVDSSKPEERERLQGRLSKLKKQIAEHREMLSHSIDEAQQRDTWEEKRQALKSKYEDKLDIAEKKASVFKQVTEEHQQQVQQCENSFKKQWSALIDGLSEQQMQPIQQTPEALKAMNFENACKWKQDIKAKIWKRHFGLFDEVLASQHNQRHKVTTRLKDAEHNRNITESDKDKAEAMLKNHGEHFVYCPSDNLPSYASLETDFSWPHEEQPAIDFELKRAGKQRYLVISGKSQIEQGIKDAARLKAKLVCDRKKVEQLSNN